MPPALPNPIVPPRPSVLRAALAGLVAVLFLLLAPPAPAQDRGEPLLWLQIEAQPDEPRARERAADYAELFRDGVSGFRLRSGWHGIVLGPYRAEEAADLLRALKRDNLIPADSYLTDGREFRRQFWPPESDAVDQITLPPELGTGDAATLEEALAAAIAAREAASAPERATSEENRRNESRSEATETLAMAQAAERRLDPAARRAVQEALRWFGHYEGAVDGAFGPGTRQAMAAHQRALGHAESGVLTTAERENLLAAHAEEVARFGFARIEDEAAGIAATIPLGLVEYDRRDPPFVHFRSRSGEDFSLVLISQKGDESTLLALFDLLQSLDAFPKDGARGLSRNEFVITASSSRRESHAWARLEGGAVKGWMLISTPALAATNHRVIEALSRDFASTGKAALEPPVVPLEESVKRGLVAGMEIARPRVAQSGFYVSPKGDVLTTAEALASCGKITLEDGIEATLTLADRASGLALLRPERALAPPAVARFASAPARPGERVTLSGYSFGARLPAPALTRGTLEENAGLEGEPGRIRLALHARAGDAGGPVLAPSGAVLGVMNHAGEPPLQELPPGVALALSSEAALAFLASAGAAPLMAEGEAPLAPAALSRLAREMTVLVSCWE